MNHTLLFLTALILYQQVCPLSIKTFRNFKNLSKLPKLLQFEAKLLAECQA
jgi:hypothetical protein